MTVTGVSKRAARWLAKKQAYKWALNFKELPFERLVNVDSVVYLSPDAEEVMGDFDPK